MKKLTFFTVLFLTTVFNTFSQWNVEDVINLKNGSIIRGSIVEWIPDSIMKIEIAGGSLLVYKASEVQFYSKQKKLKPERKNDTDNNGNKDNGKEKVKAEINFYRGFRFGTEGGWILGSGDDQNKSPLSIHLQCFYHVLPSTAIGAGVGVEFFNTTQAPVYLDLRQYLNRKYYAPYLFIQTGYLFLVGPMHDDIYGYESKGKTGYLFNPGIGFLIPLSEKSELNISFSYRYQEVKSTINDYFKPDYQRIEKMNRLNLKIGFLFH